MEQKLEKRIGELESYRYRDVQELQEILVKESEGEIPNPQVPTDFSDFKKEKVGMIWSGWDKYLWVHIDTEIPEQWRGRKVLGLFDFGRTGSGNNSGFESLLYVDETPFQGVDSNHKEVFFKEENIGKELSLTFRLWSGMEGGGYPTAQEHTIRRAAIAWLDEKTDDLYYFGKMILAAVKELDEEAKVRHNLLKVLNDSFLKVDWAYPGSTQFYASVEKADDYLNQELGKMEKNELVTVNCIGHTHIDLAWLWRLKHTKEKASRSFSTVLRLMDQFDEYIFLQTQPQIYEYIKKDFPEIYEKIKQRAKEGRWETEGAMWVEADCNLTSGESLTRQLLVGKKFIKEEFGKDMEYLWLPDVFGYSWALPQILKKSGINTFMTTKISWNEFNRIPHDTFMWRGMDGSEILTHFITTPEFSYSPTPWYYTYNGLMDPYSVKGVWKSYKDKNLTDELLVCYGYGDGGGGVNRDALEQRRRLEKIPSVPNVQTSTAGAYFKRLHEKIEHTDEYVHTWDGELYLEFHRGTYTSHARNKKWNRKMELLYREAEWISAMSAIESGNLEKAEQETLTEGWKIILRHQFHDIIPGSSIFTVYEDSEKEYSEAKVLAEAVEERGLASLAVSKADAWSVLNNGTWTSGQIAVIPESREGVFKDAQGRTLKSQRAGELTYVQMENLPGMSGAVVSFEACENPAETVDDGIFTISPSGIETPFYTIELNEAGQITRLYDKELDREVLGEGQRANVLQIFEDKPCDYDAWNIDIFYQEKMQEVQNLVSAQVLENGTLRGVLRLEWKYGNSKIVQDMIVYASDRRIDFKTYVDWHEQHQLLKASFTVDVRTTEARYDIQYGNVARPNNWNTSWEMAKFETVAHKWVDLSERDFGVSLLNDCKYGHDVKDNCMRLTLIKCATYPDYKQDQGEHEFTYSLFPHKGDFVIGKTVQAAYALNQPLKVIEGAWKNDRQSFLEFNTEQVELDAVKRSEDGKYLVVRFHEYTGSRQRVTVKTGFSYDTWCEADLMENPLDEQRKSGEVTMTVKPYEIKTLLFKIK